MNHLFEGLWDSPKAYLIADFLKNTGKSVLVLTGGTREDSLFANLSFFAKDPPIEFPAWETLPGEEIPPSPDIIGKRFEALDRLIHKKGPVILLCPIPALLLKVAPPKQLRALLHRWKVGSRIDFDQIPQILTDLGYRRSTVVSDKGEFAVRGGIIDLFPVASSDPFRVEFTGDEIETIRTFDPVGQKSIAKADSLFLCPAKENALTANITDYLGPEFIVFWDELLSIEDAIINLKEMPGSRSVLFTPFADIWKLFSSQQQVFCSDAPLEELSFAGVPFQATRTPHSFARVMDCLDHLPEGTVFLNTNETEEAEMRRQLPMIPKKAHFEKGYLSSGFVSEKAAFVPNVEFSKRAHIRRQKWRSTSHTPASEFHELTPGDRVVHFHNGIGIYRGMETQSNHLGKPTEFLVLEYAGESKLFVPLSQAYLISRYIGTSEEGPTLSQLGGKRWQATKATAQAQIVGYANELLQLYAERAVKGGFRYPEDGTLMRQFEEEFPYIETEDQKLAIEAIKENMTAERLMDRLLCGDVGYGKTEVAMRAAFKAVADGKKQVAVLVPTTVLALQHYETFIARMKGFPIRIACVSRFNSPKQTKEAIEKTKSGQVDILIGTHRILSKDIAFHDLGLIIIDEEQRFGVKAKEHLKTLKLGADCLTLSATPIPRTLYLSLVHAKEMSVISTPPQDRLPIKTIIAETEPELIQNALLRERARGGQAFFIHNRVESIYHRADIVQKLIPSLRIGVVHGQMDSEAIDAIFHRFKQGELDLLFATTIIENGVDIPNANTILIDRADTYGMADLYQLRGRVGRWNRAAYAYFLIPKDRVLPEPSRKRLNALVESSGYGGGMKIAMRDLEIRGAGDILGIQQSGQVSAIGFHLYCKLLKRATLALKNKTAVSFNETKMEFSFDARIPEEYIAEVSLRMEIYYRLGEASALPEVDEIWTELKDRFGTPPLPVLWLYHLARIRVVASQHHYTSLQFQQLSFIAEQQKGKEISRKTILLPKKVQSPKELEAYVIERLQ